MNRLWSQRFNQYLKEVGKYGQLIFNDHFSIILLILLSFGALYYRDVLTQIQSSGLVGISVPGAILVTLVIGGLFYFGHPYWFTKDPDRSYLFPRGTQWHQYWLRGTMVALILPLILLALGVIVLMPIASLTTSWQIEDRILLILILAVAKVASFLLDYLSIFTQANMSSPVNVKAWVTLLMAILLFISSLIIRPWNLIILGLGAGLMLLAALIGLGTLTKHGHDFEYVVEREGQRVSRFYRWVSLFADVPQLTPAVKRRGYLDKLIESIPSLNNNRYSYLFVRTLFRNNAYSGIWTRVMIFMAIMMFFTQSPWIILAVGVIGHILTIIQLMPLIHHQRNQAFQRLYAYPESTPVRPFQLTVGIILGIQSLVYGIVAILAGVVLSTVLFNLALWLGFALVLILLYIPWWYRRKK